jgi:acyl carrier protein
MKGDSAEQDLKTLKEILCRLLSQTNIADEEDIYLAGLTSIMVLPLLTEIEDTFHVSIPDDDFLNVRTPLALAKVIQRVRAA